MKLKIIITGSILILLVTLLIFLFIFSCKDIRVNNKAVKAFNNGDFESAAESFNKEILKQPRNYSILNNAAGAEYKLNKFGNAKLKYDTVINSSYSYREEKFIALYDLGNVEYMEGNFQKSADLYKEVLKLTPEDKDAKYNLEAALLKLNEKNSSQNNNKNNKQDKQQNEQQSNEQNNSDKQTNKEEQDLKKQMDQNEKAQKENEEKHSEANKSAEKNGGRSQSQQKDLDEEKQNLEKQRQEISDKIKAIKDKKQSENKISKNDAEIRNNESQKDKQGESFEANLQEKKDNKKDMQSAMFLNYYDESDKKAGKLRNKNKNPLLSQPKKDW